MEATLSFVESQAGRYQRDEAALLRALEFVEASRTVRRAEFQAYATRRREAKRQGRRSPRSGETNPYEQRHWYWYGAPKEAALHALRFWRSRHLPRLAPATDPVLLELSHCVTEYLDSREAQRTRLSELEQRLNSWDLVLLIRHIEVASGLR
ncbi:hypothetical protein SAMN05444920_104528 [Nonomuraea solani]|uniref:Uncharacterized protein n=2 Tax=Nonomuraea solani TaxID=1144553 RepID=A0A1H6CXM9_9ACTN|nr:hypothetical protein SAMN05444920_104528 [Nonomuraea solani]